MYDIIYAGAARDCENTVTCIDINSPELGLGLGDSWSTIYYIISNWLPQTNAGRCSISNYYIIIYISGLQHAKPAETQLFLKSYLPNFPFILRLFCPYRFN